MNRGNILCSVLTLVTATGAASAQWSDNFDSYDDGTVLDNVGGWAGWDDDPNVAGVVTADQARSGPHSVMISNGSGNDAVYQLSGYDSGQWTVTAYQFVPGDIDGLTYFIINNEYSHGGPKEWTIEMHMDPFTGLVNEQIHDPFFDFATDLVFDQWVEIRVEFDLDNNLVEAYYNGTFIGSGAVNSRGEPIEIQSIDLYGPHEIPQYFDDISVMGAGGDCTNDPNGCGDWDEDGDSDADDFFGFLDDFASDSDCADLDDDGDRDADDFFAFLDAFVQDC